MEPISSWQPALPKSRSRDFNAHNNRHKLEFTIESKGLDGLVTQIDRYSEELLIAMLKESYPTHSFLGEEFGLIQEGKGNEIKTGAGSLIH